MRNFSKEIKDCVVVGLVIDMIKYNTKNDKEVESILTEIDIENHNKEVSLIDEICERFGKKSNDELIKFLGTMPHISLENNERLIKIFESKFNGN